MAVSAWSATTAFSVGDIRRPTVNDGSGLFFRCTTAGTSAATEPGVNANSNVPNWPKHVGDTVQDGTCKWTAIASAYEELAKVNPSAIIELFELRLDSALHGSSDIYRFHAGANAAITGNIVFNSLSYTRIAIEADGFEYSNTGTLPRPRLSISNLDNTMTILLALVNDTTAGNDLGGAEVRRIRTLKKYLDGESSADPNARFPDERWFVDRKSNESRDSVTFELASKFDLAGQFIPRRQIIANICQWEYRGDGGECPYDPQIGPGKTIEGINYRRFNAKNEPVTTDAEDVCGKLVSSCKCRFGDNNELPFGSFPGAGLIK